MNILIIRHKRLRHFDITKEHLLKIKEVDSSIEVTVAEDAADAASHVPQAEVMVGVFSLLPPVKKAINLKWVHGFGVGADGLEAKIITSPILVSNSSGVAAIPIAEHILTFLLMFTKKVYATFVNQQQKNWEKQNLTELYGKTVLIVGLGHIGKEAARLVSCMGAKVMAIDQAQKEKPDFVEILKTKEEFNELLPLADFVVICVPLTKETHHLFGAEKFKQMKSTAVLVNIGRGAIVHEKELIDALENKVIAGAALDVQEIEPLPQDSPLWSMENVIITPHHSQSSERYMDRAIDLFCENLKAYLKGERLPNLIEKERGY